MLTEAQNDYLTFLLGGLAEVKSKLKELPRSFVEQMQERHSEFEMNTRISPKQLAWLERLYKEYIGQLD